MASRPIWKAARISPGDSFAFDEITYSNTSRFALLAFSLYVALVNLYKLINGIIGSFYS